MLTGEFVALLDTVTLPVAPPAPAGAKVTFKVAVCPGVRVCPEDTPLALNPGPDKLTLPMETLEFPELLIVAERILLLETFTLLKPKLVMLELSSNVAAFTVKLAALLLTLPTELLTTTVNCALLSAMVVAGVV